MKPTLIIQSAMIKVAKTVMFGVFSVMALASCGGPKINTLWEAQCDSKPLRLEKGEKAKFSTVDTWAQLVWGDKAPISLDRGVLGYQLPYDPSVYGAAPFEKIDIEPRTYLSAQTRLNKLRTVIYIDPAHFSRDEFDTLVKCLKTHAAAISNANDSDASLQPFQIAGAVYGNHADFVETFTKNAKDYYEVDPDGSTGRIQLDAMGIKGMRSESVGGLSHVENQNRIRITDPKEASIAMLKQYKNPRGQSLPERFHIIEADKAPK